MLTVATEDVASWIPTITVGALVVMTPTRVVQNLGPLNARRAVTVVLLDAALSTPT